MRCTCPDNHRDIESYERTNIVGHGTKEQIKWARGDSRDPRGLSKGRVQEDEDEARRKIERNGENALKRVIRSRGRYQVQTSFGAYKREPRCASTIRTQMATRTHHYEYTIHIRVHTCASTSARDLLWTSSCNDVNSLDFEKCTHTACYSRNFRRILVVKSEYKITHIANATPSFYSLRYRVVVNDFRILQYPAKFHKRQLYRRIISSSAQIRSIYFSLYSNH